MKVDLELKLGDLIRPINDSVFRRIISIEITITTSGLLIEFLLDGLSNKKFRSYELTKMGNYNARTTLP